MIANSILLRRLVLPLLSLGTLLGVIVFWALSAQQSSSLQRERGSRAAFIAREVALLAQTHPVAEDVLLHVGDLDRQVFSVRRVDLVDFGQQKVLATTGSSSVDSMIDPTENRFSAVSKRISGAGGEHHVYRFVEPVSFDGIGLSEAIGKELRLVIQLDGTSLVNQYQNQLGVLMAIILLGGVFVLFRRLVMLPLASIRRDLTQKSADAS